MILGLGIWLLLELTAALLVMGLIVAVDWPLRAMAWALICIAGIAWLNGIDVLGWVASNPGTILGGIAAWLFIGGASSIFFWNRYLASDLIKDKVARARKYWEGSTGKAGGEFTDSSDFKEIFNLGKDMWRIANWVIWWPFKWVNYILGSFVTDAVTWIARNVADLYGHMARSKFKS